MTDDTKTDNGSGEPGWRSAVYGILPHPVDARVWLIQGQAGWTLPQIQVEEEIGPLDLGRVTALMRQVLDLDVVAYRYADYTYDEEGRSITGVFALDYRGAASGEPAGGQWAGRAMLSTVPIVPEEHRAVLDAYLDEIEGRETPRQRPPWAYRGWFHKAEAWIDTQLAELGYARTSPVEQVRAWSLSCVLRAPTTSGLVYFKTAVDLPLFAHEPALLEGLGTWFPDHIPSPLRIDSRERWMLLADWGESIGWEASLEEGEAMYRTLARLQIDASGRADRLLSIGCVDRRLDVLAAQIDPLLEDPQALALLEDGELAQLRALAPRLKAMCEKLASYNLPSTLVHGDLHPGNVARRDGKMLFFDWTDASLAHPFFDLMHLFHAEPEVQTRLRNSYFEAWTAFEPLDRLEAAWALAAPLSALHHTVSYQYILAGIESVTRPELASGLTFFGRKVLELMPAGPP